MYEIWRGMRKRCNYPKNANYKWYGGKGIKVCSAWDDYKIFHDWALEAGYNENLTIERINRDGDYSPDNCKWITMSEQQRHKSSNHVISHNGETHCLTEWAEMLNIKPGTLWARIKKGWTVERAFTQSVINL